jgi:hypothetical protein
MEMLEPGRVAELIRMAREAAMRSRTHRGGAAGASSENYQDENQ